MSRTSLKVVGRVKLAKILLGSGLAVLLFVPVHAQTVEYIHTDALGSPVVVTDTVRAQLEHIEYEPFGKVLVPASPKDGPGYAGHVFDTATSTNYMQQRYYDPAIGRFLSTDPVTANGNTGSNFNRYWYASNNPYSRVDPDGSRDIYIGGASDKDDTRIVQNFAETQMKLHPDRDIQYFGWHEHDRIHAALEAPLAKNEPLNVVGHSLGGREAVSQANDTSARITNLITIDPVGGAGSGSKPPNVFSWTNVTAQTRTKIGWSDIIAYAGRRLEGVTNATGADNSQSSDANHGDFWAMMKDIAATRMMDSTYQDEFNK
jgi:RHS repeat-associated protein